MNPDLIIEHTRRWIETFVIGYNFCPFARRVFEAGKIRYVVSEADNEKSLLKDLSRELHSLRTASIDAVETTLLIHPRVFGDFLDYNDFLDKAEQCVEDLALTGVVQVASFHPDYQFADTQSDDVQNYTNRSPYPMLHLLREDSITAIAWDEDALLEIPEKNIETLQSIGLETILKQLAAIRAPAPPT